MAVSDQDHAPLERWAGMRSAETAVVWDAHLGGYPVCLIGIESKPVPRFGFVPADGPDQWTAGTLFPLSSKKVARAINARQQQSAGCHSRQSLGIRRLAGIHAPPATGVRRRDRPGGGELQRAHGLLRHLPLSRRRLRRVLARAERAA